MFRILLVDDEPLECEAIRLILERDRPEVKVVGQAGSGRKALDLALRLKPDIVFMDIQMPGVNGLEATRTLIEALPGLKTIVLTAYDEFEFAQKALKLGASDYLLKPARPHEILRVVDEMCRQITVAAKRREEEDRLRKELETMMPFVATGLLLDLISEPGAHLEGMEERASFLGLTSGPYQVILVDIDHFAAATQDRREVERQVLKKEVYQALLRAVDGLLEALVTPFVGNTFVVLARVPEGERQGRELAERLRSEVATSTLCTVTVGVGVTCENLIEVPSSYVAAKRAVQYGSFFGSNQVVMASDIEGSGGDPKSYPYPLEARLSQCVRLGEAELAQGLFRELRRGLNEAAGGEAELLRAYTLELAVVLTRAALDGGAGREVLGILQRQSLEQLAAARTALAVEEWAAYVLDRCLEAVLAGHAAVRNETIMQVKRYIREHFLEAISLADVAREVHLSPFHLSRLFKEKEGVNFVEYLTRLRLDEAKRLLVQTNDTIAAVAQRVGYAEANYFSRLFRRYFGVSPNEYRQRHLRVTCDGSRSQAGEQEK